jgi:hypothetical protein
MIRHPGYAAVLKRGSVLAGNQSPVTRVAEQISSVLNLSSPLPAVSPSGKLEQALRWLAGNLHAASKLNLDEAFVDATLPARKRGFANGTQAAMQGGLNPRLSPPLAVLLSPSVVQSPSPNECQLI